MHLVKKGTKQAPEEELFSTNQTPQSPMATNMGTNLKTTKTTKKPAFAFGGKQTTNLSERTTRDPFASTGGMATNLTATAKKKETTKQEFAFAKKNTLKKSYTGGDDDYTQTLNANK